LNAFKSGVVFDPIHISDLMSIDLTPYRVVVFGNTYLLTDEEITLIQNRVARDGRTLLWFYAPGYTDGTTLDAARISELTGIQVAPTALSEVPEIILNFNADSTTTYRVGEEPLGPLFAVTDPEAEPLGRFTETDQVAVARKSLPGHTAWYVSLPNTDLEPMRSILWESGAHVYSRQGDIVYAGAGILAVHVKEGGKHTVTLRNGREVTLDLPEGSSTILLDSVTGEALVPGP
jgi:hypothetical protein